MSAQTEAPFVVQDEFSWQAFSACRDTDPDAFFPEGNKTPDGAVRRICGSCEVRTQCLEWAIVTDERDGVWGGLDYAERQIEAGRLGLRPGSRRPSLRALALP